MLLLLVLFILVTSIQCNDADVGYNALQFGTSTNDYVAFSIDMSPFLTSFSTCMWIKHTHTSSSVPVVVSYFSSSGNDIIITANGHYTYVVNDGGLDSLKSKFTTSAGTWFSLCLTWSSSAGTSKLYLDGKYVGTDQTPPGKTLTTGAQLWLGRSSSSWISSSSHVFGGQLYQYNMFTEVLSAATIRKIVDGGLCFDLDELSETRVLLWEDILKKSRSGSVWEVTVCHWKKKFGESQASLNETETELRMIKEQFETLTGQFETLTGQFGTLTGQFGTLTGQFETLTGQLNRTKDKLETETGRFNASQAELDTVRGQLGAETAELNKTEEELETCSANLTKTKSQLDGARTFENITRWDVLYTSPYYNKVFSDDLYEQLTASWSMLRE